MARMLCHCPCPVLDFSFPETRHSKRPRLSSQWKWARGAMACRNSWKSCAHLAATANLDWSALVGFRPARPNEVPPWTSSGPAPPATKRAIDPTKNRQRTRAPRGSGARALPPFPDGYPWRPGMSCLRPEARAIRLEGDLPARETGPDLLQSKGDCCRCGLLPAESQARRANPASRELDWLAFSVT